MTFPFEELLSSDDGLTVISSQDAGFMEALTSRTFVSNFPSDIQSDLLPEAVIVAITTVAVQKAVQFCHKYKLNISPRTGGHNWHSIFLQGKNTVILDVGGLDSVQFEDETKTILAGPGATSVNTKIPKEYFFPSGHCPSVPLGGFVLGGGYGIGFPKYGMACSLVVGMEVVLASGEIRWVKETDDDDIAKVLMDLVKGSYHHFPAVVTKFKLRALEAPKCVLQQSFLFAPTDWKLALRYGRDMMHRSTIDTSSIETAVVFCHCPPDLVEQIGAKTMVVLSLVVWSDDDEIPTRQFLEEQTKHFEGMAISPATAKPVNAHTLARDVYGPLYPNARYITDGYFGDESYLGSCDEMYVDLIQPLADSWISDDGFLPGPHSHTLFVLCNKSLRQVNGCDLACGFVPSFEVMSYAIFEDDTIDGKVSVDLKKGLEGLRQSSNTWTVLPEGNIRTGKAAFRGWEDISAKLKLLDPDEVFKKK
ncbi:FAD linked oxidase-like protein [Nitzschia inconspicua]|uniref:FAD linked oxidase-like protein n=1 Tax=Nitzschia inconspicua TaxID=303405 RepID=A0A9K3L733_9STRA|nr:FAD linked oxidase-like protein [Nitzschia inconspicua]